MEVRNVTLPPTVRAGESVPMTWEVSVHSCDPVKELRVVRSGADRIDVSARTLPMPDVCTTEAAHWETAGVTIPPDMLGGPSRAGSSVEIHLNGQPAGRVSVQ
ncbi:hypothetical protein Dcae01_01445 [Deinococcus caeni]|uniref:Uncharacterized protein n=1 Tax=Deinococcus caeni TaxID=569127 RepID=A0ABP9UBN0_9DEIO